MWASAFSDKYFASVIGWSKSASRQKRTTPDVSLMSAYPNVSNQMLVDSHIGKLHMPKWDKICPCVVVSTMLNEIGAQGRTSPLLLKY
jgi:hypothetical protein